MAAAHIDSGAFIQATVALIDSPPWATARRSCWPDSPVTQLAVHFVNLRWQCITTSPPYFRLMDVYSWQAKVCDPNNIQPRVPNIIRVAFIQLNEQNFMIAGWDTWSSYHNSSFCIIPDSLLSWGPWYIARTPITWVLSGVVDAFSYNPS